MLDVLDVFCGCVCKLLFDLGHSGRTHGFASFSRVDASPWRLGYNAFIDQLVKRTISLELALLAQLLLDGVALRLRTLELELPALLSARLRDLCARRGSLNTAPSPLRQQPLGLTATERALAPEALFPKRANGLGIGDMDGLCVLREVCLVRHPVRGGRAERVRQKGDGNPHDR